MAHRPSWVCLRRGRKEGEAGEEEAGVVESVLVPVAATAIVTTAAVMTDHTRRRQRERPGRERPPGPPARRTTRRAVPSFLDKIATKLPFLKPVAAVQRRYGDVGGNQLAAAFTLQAFLSIFPLLLVGIAVVGFVSRRLSGPTGDVAGRLVEQLGLQGESAKMMTDAVGAAEASRKAASIVGFLGLLWSGLGLVGALQYAYNSVWQVNDRGIKDKVFGLSWLGGAAVLFVGGAAATTALRWLPGFVAPLGIVVTFAVSLGLWLWTLRVLPNTKVPWRALVPGALLGAIGLEVLKVVGAYYVPRRQWPRPRSCTARSASCSPSWPGCCSSAGWWCTRPSSTWSATRSTRAPSGRSSRRRRCPTCGRWPTARAASSPPTN